MGKGELVGYIMNDIDGVLRPKNPTLGASEICVSSFGKLKNISMVCGDGIFLRRCDADRLTGCKWYPSIGLSDSLSVTPLAKPIQNTVYHLADSIGTILDSVLINVGVFKIKKYDKITLPSCGYSALLGGNFNPSASYTWYPVDGLSDSTIYNPIATPKIPTTYFQKISIPGCGRFVDSVFLNVNPLPVADGFPGWEGLKVTFFNFSACADSFLWNFGDGFQSFEEAPIHIYDSAGIYDGSLIASNQYGSDTFYFSVQVYYVGIGNVRNNTNILEVYPNPSSGSIHIKLNKVSLNGTFSVFNFFGQLIHTENLTSVTSFDYMLPETKGVYLIQLFQKDGSIYRRKVYKN
jgi:hypothetical protein